MPIKEMIIARGDQKAELVLKNCQVVNVLNGQIETGDIAIEKGRIVGVGEYEGIKEIDLNHKYVCPGFIDGHVHIESSMLTPSQFSRLVMPKGTTSIIADPHEIANVCGLNGIEYMLKASEKVPLDIYIMLPSCVPSTEFEVAGAVLLAKDLKKLKDHPRVIGLGEMMNYPGVIAGNSMVHEKIDMMSDRLIDGHAPEVTGKALNAYISAGVKTDHECTTKEEMLEKVGKGMYVHLREGSATRNLDELLKGVTPSNSRRLMFCSDDKQPIDIMNEGHMDHNVRRAIELGLSPITAIQMATLNIAECYSLKGKGAIAPGYEADLLILDNLEKVSIRQVYKKGILVATDHQPLFEAPQIEDESVLKTVKLENIRAINLDLKIPTGIAKVIGLRERSIITDLVIRKVDTKNDLFIHNPKLDLLKLAVIERHKNSGNVGIGLVEGYGLKHGAVALTIAHDSHNVIVIGDNDADMRLAIEELKRCDGGMTICRDGVVIETLRLEVGGLMTNAPLEEVIAKIEKMDRLALDSGVSTKIEPFLTLAFLALPVIPELKLTDQGLFDVTQFAFVKIDV
ncbi:adenine deaminase [Petrocella sp. FN5]|uniref:adenine deaminase n=1 Tax=Petrocella sp. FN5 TaxID=3032002 RepID=UPI0023DCB68D|nr:adenine deaminase [Petrocella sp. FN5]MDF1616068.1 adenine deaminase [Petrocella sp. FN5]